MSSIFVIASFFIVKMSTSELLLWIPLISCYKAGKKAKIDMNNFTRAVDWVTAYKTAYRFAKTIDSLILNLFNLKLYYTKFESGFNDTGDINISQMRLKT